MNTNQQTRRLDRQARQPRPYNTNNRVNNMANQHAQQQQQQQQQQQLQQQQLQQQLQQQQSLTGMQASMPLLDALFGIDDCPTECIVEEPKLPPQASLSNRPSVPVSRNSSHMQVMPARPQQRPVARNASQEIAVMHGKPAMQSANMVANRRFPQGTSMAVAPIAPNTIQQPVNVNHQYVRTVGNRNQPCASMAVNPGALRPHDSNSYAVVPVPPQQLVPVNHDSNINYPTYYVVFKDLIKEHKDVTFSLPRHFYNYFTVPSEINVTKVLLFKYNQRALAMEVEMNIFGDFVCCILHYLVLTWHVQYQFEVQDAPPDWLARYKKGAVVNFSNYDRLAKRVAVAINYTAEMPAVIDERFPEPITLYITAQKNHLLIVFTWNTTDDGKEKQAKHATVGTQTDFVVLPAYYMPMLRDQIAAMTISDINSDEGFFEHQEIINTVENAQKSIADQMQDICEKFDASLKLQQHFLNTTDVNSELFRQYSTSKDVQTEDAFIVEGEVLQTLELPAADAIFDTFEEYLFKIIQYSASKYKKYLAIFQDREAEYKNLKYELAKKESHSHRDQKRSDKYDSKHHDKDKKVYSRKDEKRSPSRSNKDSKENRDERRRSESKSRSSTSSKKRSESSRKPDKIGYTVNEDFPDGDTFLEGIKAILIEHNLGSNMPDEEVKPDPPEPSKTDPVTVDAFELYLSEISAEPIKYDTPSSNMMAQNYSCAPNYSAAQNYSMAPNYSVTQNSDFNILSDYDMCLT